MTETIANYGTAERRAQDRAMIEDPMRWPQMRLPLKNPSRYNGDEDRAYGWLFTPMAWSGLERVVMLGTIFETETHGEERFADVDALLDAGWTVD